MSKVAGRKRIAIDDDLIREVDEIIELKIKDLDGLVSKLTNNNVWEFNKKILKESLLNATLRIFGLVGIKNEIIMEELELHIIRIKGIKMLFLMVTLILI